MNASNLKIEDLENLQTIRDWLRFFVSRMTASQVFYGHGCLNALDESVYLIQHALSLPLEDISPYLEARITESEKKTLWTYLEKRTIQRLPAAYITGESWLQGQRFKVDERVIIPRSFIAELLADQLTPWLDNPFIPLNVLDLCTGSACLGILAAHALPEASVDCVDISEEALEVAAINVAAHKLEQRVNLIHSDLYSKLGNQQYDVILTNPPYVNSTSMSTLPPEYLHEPGLALAGGDDGMSVIRTILSEAYAHLKDGGFILVELGNEREFFEDAFPQLNPVWLEVSAGSDQVFLLHKQDLAKLPH